MGRDQAGRDALIVHVVRWLALIYLDVVIWMVTRQPRDAAEVYPWIADYGVWLAIRRGLDLANVSSPSGNIETSQVEPGFFVCATARTWGFEQFDHLDECQCSVPHR